MVVGRLQLLKGCWAEGLSSLLVFVCRLPSVPGNVGLPSMAACFLKHAIERESIYDGSPLEVNWGWR